ncbi:hypothetical protein G7054_g11672 [Neopestalotiopsis clavispora]|nr:hypothetical protein G7054_g11672 [Neopestalotiopsis clavispora]
MQNDNPYRGLNISHHALSAALQEEAMSRIQDSRLWNLGSLDHVRFHDWDYVVFYTNVSGHHTWWILEPCEEGEKLRIDELTYGLEMRSDHWKKYGKPGFTATVKTGPWYRTIICTGNELHGTL